MESRRNHFSVSLPIVNSKVWWLIVCWSQVACQLFSMLVSFYSFNSFICLWLCRVFIAARGLSLLEVGGATLLRCSGLSLWRLSCGGAQALGARAHLLWGMGQTRVPCLGRGIPLHCASREVFSGLVLPGLDIRPALFASWSVLLFPRGNLTNFLSVSMAVDGYH